MVAPHRKLWPKLALALATCVLTVGSIEGCARLLDLRPRATPNTIPAWVEKAQLHRDAGVLHMFAAGDSLGRFYDLYEWDRYRFYRTRANLELEMLDFLAPAAVRARTKWHVETNSMGFRDDEFEREPADGRYRVLAVGDSTTFGWGVAEDDGYVSVAERELARRHPERKVEILNLGTPGYSSFQGLVLLRDALEKLDADAILFSFGANDLQPMGVSDRELYALRTSRLGALHHLLQRSHAYQTGREWLHELRGARGPQAIPDPHSAARTGVVNTTLEDYRQNLEEVAGLGQARRVPVVFLAVCQEPEQLDAMRQVALARGVGFLDARDEMMRRAPELLDDGLHSELIARVRETYGELERSGAEPPVLLPDGCHPNAIGHRLLGEALAERVSSWLTGGS